MPDERPGGRTAAKLAAASRQLQDAIENAQRVRAEIEATLKSVQSSIEREASKTPKRPARPRSKR